MLLVYVLITIRLGWAVPKRGEIELTKRVVCTTFVKAHLARVIRLTSERRSSRLPLTIKVFAQPFIDDKQSR